MMQPTPAGDERLGPYVVRFVGSIVIDGYTRYSIEVFSPDGSSWDIQRRYREIHDLHVSLRSLYGDMLPEMPGKRIFGNQDPTFIMERQAALEDYVNRVLQLECRAYQALSPQSRSFLAACKAGLGVPEERGLGHDCRTAPLQLGASSNIPLVDAPRAWTHSLMNAFTDASKNVFGLDLCPLGEHEYSSVAGNLAAATAREDFAAAVVYQPQRPPQHLQRRAPPVQDPFEAPETLRRIASAAGVETSSRLGTSCHAAHARLRPVISEMRI